MDKRADIPPSKPRKSASVEVSTAEIAKSFSLVRATLESTLDGILIVNRENHIVDCNQKFIAMWKIPPNVIESGDEMAAFQFVLDQVLDPEKLYKLVTRLYDNIEEKGDLGEVYFKDGRVFERYSQPHRLDNEIVGRVWSFRDVTERKKSEESLRLQQQAISASPHGTIITDISQPDHPIIYVNPAFEKITGYSSAELVGKNCRLLQGSDRDQVALQKIRSAIKNCREENVELRNYRKDGSLFWNLLNIAPVQNPSGEVKHYVGIMIDITEQRLLEQQLIHQATHDVLTGLPNKSLLIDRMEQALLQVKKNKNLVAMLYLDLDQFKVINDNFGHPLGDQILKIVARRLSSHTRDTDTVARIGGDEFVVILPNVENEECAYQKAKAILEKLSKPITIDKKSFTITTSIGISFYPKDGDDFNALLKNSDICMYMAKENGRNNFKTYTDALNDKIIYRMSLESDLLHAVEKKEFILHYQPLIDLTSMKIFGAEALLRWIHPELGLISPIDFIPIAEKNSLMVSIGEWVMQESCHQLKQWQTQGFKQLTMSINLSAQQLQEEGILDTIKKWVEHYQLNPRDIDIEITESILLENIESAVTKLNEFKSYGLQLSIDDFGTGYSSLNYLMKFPADTLKIDRTFVKDLDQEKNNPAIAIAIINLGKVLNLKILAEGIETKEQLEFLQENICDAGQGYYFSRPVEPGHFTTLLKKTMG